jgi:hypothetical protein
MAAFLTANSYLGLIPETTSGTLPSSGTPSFFPITAPQVTPQQTFLRDEALRGSPTTVYDMVEGVRHDEVDFKTFLYADTFPWLLTAILGGNDTVAGASPYTHAIGLYNNATKGSQPKTYSILDFDGANFFTVTGAQADSLMLSFGAEAAAEATMKFMTNPYTSYTSAPAPFTSLSLSTEHLIPAWNTSISVGGTSLNYISTGELSFARKTAPIFTMGTQSPYDLFAGPLEVTGKFTAVVSSNADPFSTPSTYTPSSLTSSAYALSRAPQAVVITLTDADESLATSVQFTMSQVQFQNVKRTRGKEYTEVEVDFVAEANVTDGGASNTYSPVKTITTNARSTAYQTGY